MSALPTSCIALIAVVAVAAIVAIVCIVFVWMVPPNKRHETVGNLPDLVQVFLRRRR